MKFRDLASVLPLCAVVAGPGLHAEPPADAPARQPAMRGVLAPAADGGLVRTLDAVRPVESLPLSVLALRQPLAAPADTQRLVPNREDEGPVPEGPQLATQGVYVDQKEPGKGNAPGLGTIGFQGLSAAGVAPPDSDGNVGPGHYLQWINSRIAVFDKTSGVMAPGFPISGSALFSALGGVCATHNDGDPIVLYDSLADRWQISQFVVGATEDPAANSHQCIAVSKGPDPTGAWYLYDFPTVFGAPDDFIDYEKLSTWTDAYYMTGKSFCSSGTFCTSGLYGVLYAFERARMLVGLPARMVAYANPAAVGGTSAPNILTTDIDGLTPPPPGRPAHAFWQKTTTSLDVVSLATTWGATPAMTVTALPDIAITATTSVSCTSNGSANRRCVPQPTPATDPNDQLDALSSRLMFRAAYRNHGGTESVVLNHTIAGTSPVKAAVRWYEIQLQTGTPTLIQSGTFAPDNTNRWMGSIAMDASGNIALGYSRSARAAVGPPVVPAVIPEVSVAGRLAGDPPGTMTGDTVLKAGVGVQSGTGNRWGDYSTMNVDPRDGCTFWYQAEFLPSNGSFNWSNWIGTATYAPGNCSPETWGKVAGTVTYAETGAPVAGALVSAAVYSGATVASGAYELAGRPGAYTVTAAAPRSSCTATVPPSASLTITNGGTVTQNFTVDGNDDLNVGTVTLDDTPGNGNGAVNLNECFRLTIPLRNDGCRSASGVSAVVTSPTPGVTVKSGFSAYPDAAIGATQGNAAPFELATSPSFVCGTDIVVNVDVTSASGTVTRSFELPSCVLPDQAFSGNIQATDLSQNPRQFRDGVVTDCAGKPCTAPTVTGTFYYDKYTYTNAAATARCYTVNVNSPGTCNNAVFLAAYSPSFAGNGSCTNFVGDIGSNPGGAGSFQFTVPAGQQFELVVTATTVSATCNGYAGSVSGFVSLADGGRPTAAASGTATICPGQSTTLSGSGGTACSWTPVTGLDDPSSCTPNVSPTSTTTYSLSVATAGGCTSGNTSQVTVTVTPDGVDPTVTAPAPVTIDQALCCGTFGGATGAASATLATFLAGGSATDDCDPAPARLSPQVGAANATNATCFEVGATSVTFRYQDAAGNVGTATSGVTVRMYGDLDMDGTVGPADMNILQSYFNFAATPGVPPFAAPLEMANLSHADGVGPEDMVQLQAYFNFALTCLAP